MRISTQGNQFIFNLPSDFLTQDIVNTYTPILEKNWIQYENIIDYLNSTIKAINFPGINFETPKQLYPKGKERFYKPAKPVQDIITTRDLTVDFRSVDSDLNYFLMFDIIIKHYTNNDELYVQPFTLTCLDIHRDAIYKIHFYQIILKALSDRTFNYSQQKVSEQTFTMTFSFNFYEIEFLLNKSKILETSGGFPIIINKNP
jgi:hypothetical protein